MKKNNESGMTLITVIIAAAITSVILLSLISSVSLAQREARKSREATDLILVRDEARLVWSQPPLCKESFLGKKIKFSGPFAPSESSKVQRLTIAHFNGGVISTFNSKNSIDLKDADFKLITGDPSTRSFTAEVSLLPRSKSGEIIPYLRPLSLFLDLQLNSSLKIVSCHTSLTGGEMTANSLKGIAPIVNSSDGSFLVTFSSPSDTLPKFIGITPRWSRYTKDEDTTWWVDHVTKNGFQINWHGPTTGSATLAGTSGVYWKADF